jgi:hypothetical protein
VPGTFRAAPRLRFVSRKSDRLIVVEGKVDGRQLQTMRELTEGSADLLRDAWEAGRRAPSRSEAAEGDAAGRNPAWARGELILALHLYSRVNPLHTSESHSEIRALSELLNALPLHPVRPGRGVFRKSTGVYMRLCNFLRFDPGYSGR